MNNTIKAAHDKIRNLGIDINKYESENSFSRRNKDLNSNTRDNNRNNVDNVDLKENRILKCSNVSNSNSYDERKN